MKNVYTYFARLFLLNHLVNEESFYQPKYKSLKNILLLSSAFFMVSLFYQQQHQNMYNINLNEMTNVYKMDA